MGRFCSNFAHLLRTPRGTCRRILSHVTKWWGEGRRPKFWESPHRNSRTAGPILFKLCTFVMHPNGRRAAGLWSRDQMLAELTTYFRFTPVWSPIPAPAGLLFILVTFLRFLTFFIFSTFFILKKRWQNSIRKFLNKTVTKINNFVIY